MFGSYERSLKALSKFYNLVAMVTFPSQPQVQEGKKSINGYSKQVIQVKINFLV